MGSGGGGGGGWCRLGGGFQAKVQLCSCYGGWIACGVRRAAAALVRTASHVSDTWATAL